jgi:nucleotide-binding universal stress UspA family protein
MTGTTSNAPPAPGSTHEDVLAHTQPSHAARTVALALDNSSHSEFAFTWALENLIQPSDHVVLLHVRPYVFAPVLYTPAFMEFSDEYRKMDEANKQFSHELIRKYAKELVQRNISARGVALRGDPRDEIVYKVKDLKADVLIMGSRGMGAVKRTFLGSTSDYVLHHSHCTVVIPKKPE